MYIGGLYIGGLGEGGSSLKKKKNNGSPFLGHLSPKVYTHTMFVFPPAFSLGIFMILWTFVGNLWQPAIRERLCT